MTKWCLARILKQALNRSHYVEVTHTRQASLARQGSSETHNSQFHTKNMNYPSSRPSPFLEIARARAARKIRIPIAKVPRHQPLASMRAVVAAQRAAELAAWQATGGDFLRR
ncbi:MAG: hypothetical protein JWM16_1448 [Verrucomicrobiales bacterium]|nr:hypothetical protein [Verrucomicrobiales bacterium]